MKSRKTLIIVAVIIGFMVSATAGALAASSYFGKLTLHSSSFDYDSVDQQTGVKYRCHASIVNIQGSKIGVVSGVSSQCFTRADIAAALSAQQAVAAP